MGKFITIFQIDIEIAITNRLEIYSSFTTDSDAFVFEVGAELTLAADSDSLSAFSRFSKM